MKKAKRLFAALLALAMLLALTGCGNALSMLQKVQKSGDAGYYILTSMSAEGYTFEGDDLKTFSSTGEMYIQLKEDKTGVLFMCDDVTPFTWEPGTATFGPSQFSGEKWLDKVSYTLEGDTLSMETDGMELVFTRSDGTPPPLPSAPPEEPEEPGRQDGNTGVITLGDYEVSYVDACLMLDYDGEDAVVITLDFTNNSSEAACYAFSVWEQATQDDEWLDSAVVLLNEDYEQVTDSQIEDVRPGRSIEVRTAFALADPSEPIVFSVEALDSNDSGEITIDPADLWYEDSYVPDSSGGGWEDDTGWWDGDWYGWWYLSNAEGNYWTEREGEWNDCCATITTYGDGSGYLEIWDERGEGRNLLVECEVEFGPGFTLGGCMYSVDGNFYGDDRIGEGDWLVDASESYFMNTGKTVSSYDHMICIEGTYTDPEYGGGFDYTFYLKPWGYYWDDVEEDSPADLPDYYYDWYLPLINAGENMPYAIGG